MTIPVVRVIFWDFDGTIAPTLPLYIEAIQRTGKDVGKSIRKDAVIAALCPSEREILETLGIGDEWARFLMYYRELHKKLCPACYKGVLRLLHKSQRYGILNILVTDKSQETLRISLKKLGIQSYFPTWDSRFGYSKREVMTNVLNLLQISPVQCVFLCDLPRDVQAGNAIGVPVYVMNFGDSSIDWSSVSGELRFDVCADTLTLWKSIRRCNETEVVDNV